VWLRTVGERGWVVLTKDQRLRYRPLEIAALRASKARVFVLTAGNLRGVEIAATFLGALPQIFKFLCSVPGPFHLKAGRIGCRVAWRKPVSLFLSVLKHTTSTFGAKGKRAEGRAPGGKARSLLKNFIKWD